MFNYIVLLLNKNTPSKTSEASFEVEKEGLTELFPQSPHLTIKLKIAYAIFDFFILVHLSKLRLEHS